jgi:hypothetical protein
METNHSNEKKNDLKIRQPVMKHKLVLQFRFSVKSFYSSGLSLHRASLCVLGTRDIFQLTEIPVHPFSFETNFIAPPAMILGFDFRRGLGIFLFTTASRMALGPTQPPIQWVPGALSLGLKRPGREADHLPPSSAEVKECVELYLHSPIRLHGVALN